MKNNKEYREEFPTLGGQSRQQKAKATIESKTISDFPVFDIAAGGQKKGPVKYSDFEKNLMKQENEKHKQKMMAKYFGAKPGGDNRFSQQEAKLAAQQKAFLRSIGSRVEQECES